MKIQAILFLCFGQCCGSGSAPFPRIRILSVLAAIIVLDAFAKEIQSKHTVPVPRYLPVIIIFAIIMQSPVNKRLTLSGMECGQSPENNGLI